MKFKSRERDDLEYYRQNLIHIDDRYNEQQRILAIGNLVHENPKITRLNLNLILNILFDVPGKSLYFFPGISVSTL